MNVLLLSEHYSPKISGTVSYIKNLISSYPKEGNQFYLLCPSKGEINSLNENRDELLNITFLNFGVNKIQEPLYSSAERMILCDFVKNSLGELVDKYEINTLHLLYGHFLSEIIDTEMLRRKSIKSLFTIHNIPPQECSISWDGDVFWRKWKDDFRKVLVKIINIRRLKKQLFDIYVVPSEQVKADLLRVLKSAKVIVTPHGGAELINNELETGRSQSTLKILTVGGLVPHKRQNWIPIIAKYLKENGVDFEWYVVGPKRNNEYANFVEQQIKQNSLSEKVIICGAIEKAELEMYYKTSNLYIQLSREEGFCLTVLDAISYGLPVMATPVGAIPEMLSMVEGILLDSDIEKTKKVILHYIKILDFWKPKIENTEKIRSFYRWDKITLQLIKAYE